MLGKGERVGVDMDQQFFARWSSRYAVSLQCKIAWPEPGSRLRGVKQRDFVQQRLDRRCCKPERGFIDQPPVFDLGLTSGYDALARQSDPIYALLKRELDAIHAGNAGLGGGIQIEIGGDCAGQANHAEILDQERVDAGFGDGAEGARRFRQFVIEDQGIEREVTTDATPMERAHDFRQFRKIEANFGPGGEMFKAEITRVRSGFNGCL